MHTGAKEKAMEMMKQSGNGGQPDGRTAADAGAAGMIESLSLDGEGGAKESDSKKKSKKSKVKELIIEKGVRNKKKCITTVKGTPPLSRCSAS